MPGLTLPTITETEVRKHSNASSCYVTVGTKVYDVTSFLAHHPGGDDLILEWAGQDVGAIMGDQISHLHSDSAFEILEDLVIGFTVTPKLVDVALDQKNTTEVFALA